jgi:hypothetical protein
MVAPRWMERAPRPGLLLLLALLSGSHCVTVGGYDCVFIEDMHFKSAGPYPHAPTLHKEHCCDLCHQTEGCAAGIFAKDPKGEEDTCWFKDAATAVKANEEKRPGNTACVRGDYATAEEKQEGVESDDGVGEWGGNFIKCLVGLGLLYMLGGVAYGRRTRSDGKSGLLWQWHPHWRQWEEVAGLVQDGVAFSRAGGRQRGGYSEVGAGAGSDGGSGNSGRKDEPHSPKREKKSSQKDQRKKDSKDSKESRGSKESKQQRQQRSEDGRAGSEPDSPEQGQRAGAATTKPEAGAPVTAPSAGGGRWVHVDG